MAATTAVIVGAFLIGACGGDQGGDLDNIPAGTPHVTTAPSPASDPLAHDGDKADIAEVLDDVQDAMAAGVPGSVCFELSEAAEDGLGGGACGPAVARIIRRQRAAGLADGRWSVVSVRAGERTAVAMVRRPGDGIARVRLLREVSEWELAHLNTADSSGLHAVK